jgi:hypothetical protein
MVFFLKKIQTGALTFIKKEERAITTKGIHEAKTNQSYSAKVQTTLRQNQNTETRL